MASAAAVRSGLHGLRPRTQPSTSESVTVRLESPIRSPGGGDNLYLSSIKRSILDDGSMVWHYQTTPGDNWITPPPA